MSILRPEHRNVTAVFGGVKRVGKWQVPRKLSVNVFIGGAQIDLRDCELPPGPTELKIRWTMSSGRRPLRAPLALLPRAPRPRSPRTRVDPATAGTTRK